MTGTVLLIDEEKLPLSYYKRALERAGYRVHQAFGPDSAMEYVSDDVKADEICAILLDIMMPPGEKYDSQFTKDGLHTGIVLLGDLRKRLPDIPIIVLTNVDNRDTLQLLSEEPHLTIASKLEYPPSALVKLVQQVTEG